MEDILLTLRSPHLMEKRGDRSIRVESLGLMAQSLTSHTWNRALLR